MKVLKPQLSIAGASTGTKGMFRALLEEARKELHTRKPLSAVGVKSIAAPSVLKIAPSVQSTFETARAHARAHAQQLAQTREGHHVVAEQALQERAVALVREDLLTELAAAPLEHLPPRLPAPVNESAVGQAVEFISAAGTVAASKGVSAPESRANQAVALIERIELFVRSARPALALTLNNSLGAHVEIERVGPREVALKLVGHRGPPSAESVSRIREEMRSRGLRVAALSVA